MLTVMTACGGAASDSMAESAPMEPEWNGSMMDGDFKGDYSSTGGTLGGSMDVTEEEGLRL